MQCHGVTLAWPLTLALSECFILPYLGYISPITNIYGFLLLIINCPLRDACLYSGETGERVGPLAPAIFYCL